MDWTLREFRPADLDVLHEIDRACYPRQIAYSRRELRSYLALPSAGCILVERAGETGGFILSESGNDEAHIITIDVLSEYRRNGLGSALLAEAERRLAARGVRRIVLETATNNAPAISFWQRHGYLTEGLIRGYYPGPLDAFVMSKSLVVP